MQRWLEEFELKHVEFMRCIKSFLTMSETWCALSLEADLPGNVAFAKRQSLIYRQLHDDAKSLFVKVAEPRFRQLSEQNFVELIRKFREVDLGWLAKYDRETRQY